MPVAQQVRVRRDVWQLSAQNLWEPTILNYAKAVAKLRTYDTGAFADPRSWRHLAEIHGSSIARNLWPRGAHWDECEHGSWYFLPWHRIYLHHFEKIVRDAVRSLGGPTTWALPYWNYTDGQRPHVRQLPPAFRELTLPDGSPNPLLVNERGPGMNGNGQLGPAIVSTTTALGQAIFSDPAGGGIVPGFGGGVSAPTHGGGIPGALENTPHGSVHIGVGGVNPPGWMSRFETAARDPIFWLHHANIDRLWAEWLRTQPHVNPTDARWLTQTFVFGSGRWHTKMAAKDVLNSRRAPLRYRYDDEPAAAAAPRRVAPVAARAQREAVVRRGPPEMLGAARNIPLGSTPTHAEIEVAEARGPARDAFAGAPQPRQWYLMIENIRGKQLPAGTFSVYVNAPANASPADLEKHFAGTISLFGVVESSKKSDRHAGEGLSYSLDVSDLIERLERGGAWDPKKLRVTFVPLPDSAQQVHAGDVKAGRVSLHRG